MYKKTVALSDGTACDIELTPTIYRGRKLVKALIPGNDDPHCHNYIGLSGLVERGGLMVQLWDLRTQQKLRESEDL